LRRFQTGLTKSKTFRDLHIIPGNYGEWGNHDNVYQLISSVDLSRDLDGRQPSDIFADKSTHPFNLSTPLRRAKT
jgi:hypothetical protein